MSESNQISPSTQVSNIFSAGLSITIVVFSYHDGKLKILIQKKTEDPIQGELGLPGHLMLVDENTDIALEKLLLSTIGFSDFYKKQLLAFSEVDRHPLGRVISFAHYGLVPWERCAVMEDKNFFWMDLSEVPKLCYDHDEILKSVMKRFRKGLQRHPNVFELLPKEFIISDIIKIYEQVFSSKSDISNFRKKLRKSDLILPTGKFFDKENLTGRRPELYWFDKANYKKNRDKIQFQF